MYKEQLMVNLMKFVQEIWKIFLITITTQLLKYIYYLREFFIKLFSYQIEQWTKDIAATHKDIIEYSVLGKSSEGRNINALTIGISHDNPLVVIDCGIHGREWISPATCLCYVDHVSFINHSIHILNENKIDLKKFKSFSYFMSYNMTM